MINSVGEHFDKAPAIIFFSLSANQQAEMLPTLKEEKLYDFINGDLLTDNALEVLIHAYEACLNRLSLWLAVVIDESKDRGIRELDRLVDSLHGATQMMIENCFEEIGNVNSLNASEWERIRHLSKILQKQLQIDLELNSKIVSSFMESWLHS